MIPLPDPNALPGSAAHVSAYQEFAAGATVMALYPDTSCFYRAEVISTPKEMQPNGRVRKEGILAQIRMLTLCTAGYAFPEIHANVQTQV